MITLTNEQINIVKGLHKMIEARLKFNKWFDEHGFFESMKDMSCAILDLADETGYDYDYLVDRIEEGVADGETYEDAFLTVAEISYEQDW